MSAEIYDDPLRLRLQKAVAEVIRRVVPSNGYSFDLLTKQDEKDPVQRGRALFGEGDPDPLISILEVPIPLDQIPSQMDNPASKGWWDLVIQGFILETDGCNPTDVAHRLMAEVKASLAREKRDQLQPGKGRPKNDMFGMQGRVTGLRIGPGVVRPPDGEVNEVTNFWLTISIEFAEDLAEPYL